MKRTTIFLPDELHERLRAEAFRARKSMAEVIRLRLESPVGRGRKSAAGADPLFSVMGVCGETDGPLLSEGIDDALYGE